MLSKFLNIRLSFRLKLFTIVGASMATFLLLDIASSMLASRVVRQMDNLEQKLVPKLELGLQMEAQFEKLRRGFQDAVAAQDLETLMMNQNMKNELLGTLERARGVVDPELAEAFKNSFENYYQQAQALSERLIAGDTGEELVSAMQMMQTQQLQTFNLLEKISKIDKSDINGAFRSARTFIDNAKHLRFWITIVCMLLLMALSLHFIRGVLLSLKELKAGFQRYSQKMFDQPIAVVSQDELGDAAIQANQMAANLLILERERDLNDILKAEQAARLKKQEEELRQSYEELKQANKELDAFSYSVSHDLRAPLRTIDGFSKALLSEYREKLENEGLHYLERIQAATQKMSTIITDLLNLSKVGRSPARRELVHLSKIAGDVLSDLKKREPQRKVEVIINPDLWERADSNLMTILLENLLNNAWKFTAKKSDARISFDCENHNGEPVFYVQDNGAGFDMTYAPQKLFTPFHRFHKASDFEGTGIGLAIVNRIISQHGGNIWAKSVIDEGTTFYFTLGGKS